MSSESIINRYQPVDDLFKGYSQEVGKKEDPLGQEAFLTMLVAQLEHQDPLNPMDGTDFTAQLAQFSSLEQSFKTNDTLEAILAAVNTGSEENLLDYIGKNIRSEDNAITVNNGQASQGSFSLNESAEVVVSIYSPDGREIKRIYLGQRDAGMHEIIWNGTDSQGTQVADGSYTYEIAAIGDGGNLVHSRPSITGEVTGVTYEHGEPYLLLDQRLVHPQTITKVWQATEET